MNWIKILSVLLLSIGFTACSSSEKTSDDVGMTESKAVHEFEIETKEIEYKSGRKTMTGYLAKPKVEGKRPAVLVVHEWWGQTDYPRKRAEMLAKMGYVAFAIDMYGKRKVLEHPTDAGKFAKKTMSRMKQVKRRFAAAMRTLKKDPSVDKEKMAAIGYCFGGGIVLEMARRGVNLDAVVSFHGALATKRPAKQGKVKSKILVLNGAADTFVKPEQIEAFKKEMETAGAEFEFVNYEGAQHGFTNPEATEKGEKFKLPLAYNEQADKESWDKMKAFFDKIFQ